MKLIDVLKGVENYKAKGDLEVEINNIDNNSKNIKEGDVFIAIKGFDFDGHDFVSDAVKQGAIAVVLDMSADLKKIKISKNTTVILVENTRKCLAKMASNFFGNPAKKLRLVGVTGTKGKTTTTFMIKSILEKAGKKVGLIGTVANYIGDKCLGESSRTTPDSLELQRIFAQMVKEKVDIVVMEVSSQSLKLDRVAFCEFEYGVFTNFYKDHISPKEHPDLEDYFNSKSKLFTMCKQGFINADDFKGTKIQALNSSCEFKTYGIDNFADMLAKDITITNKSVDYKLKIQDRNERIKVNIPGRFSVYNSLAAISVALKYGATVDNIKDALLEITVPGRSEMVANDKELAIMIDYAHTAESLQSILQAVKSYTKGNVICVFGCGGDRDSSKRPLMGEAVGKIADLAIITTDNPRTENPMDIINEIEKGIKKTKGKYKVIEDRKEAIKEAIKVASKRDIIVLAGKGHEPYQEINGTKYPFDERIIVKEIMEGK